MTRRDDMVIAPRFVERDVGSRVRARAQEDRQAEGAGRVRGRLWQRIMDAYRMRRAAQTASKSFQGVAKRRGVATTGQGTQAVRGLRGAGRAAGPVGIALLVADLLVAGHGIGRQVEGKSSRLVAAEDADRIMGTLDEQATAVSRTRMAFEGDGDLMRIIDQEGRVNSQIGRIAADLQKIEMYRASGADLIDRTPAFDSPDGIVDLLLKHWREDSLMEAAEGAADVLRELIGVKGR